MELPPALRLSYEDNPSAQDRKAVEEALAVISMQFAMTARRLRVGMMIAKPCGRVRV
jgi:hypothetical protein